MKSLKTYMLESSFDGDLLYDIIISVVGNNRTIYERCKSMAAAIARKAKRDERPDFNKLAESSAVDKLTTEVFKIYVSEYSSPGMRLGTPERKELKKWVAAEIFHILDDEFKGLTPEEVKDFENNPYFSTSDFDKTIKEALNESQYNWERAVDNFLKKTKKYVDLTKTPYKGDYFIEYRAKYCPVSLWVKTAVYTMPQLPRYQYLPSSEGKDADVQIRLLDHIYPAKDNFEKALFNEFQKLGVEEANRWRCAQWGTWKFIPRDPDELDKLTKVVVDLMKKYKL